MQESRFLTWDAYYTYPGSGVLANKLGINDAAKLKEAESILTKAAIFRLRKAPIQGEFDLDHLQKIHHAIFNPLYEWAGEPRNVTLAKRNSKFVEPELIEAEMARVSHGLAQDSFLKGMPKITIVDKLAKVLADINRIHPFREGNGRAGREFVNQLALQAGYRLDMRKLTNVRDEWNSACEIAMGRPPQIEPLKRIMMSALRPTRSVAFEIFGRDQALQMHPELKGAYAILDTKIEEAQKRYPGNDAAVTHFSAKAKADITTYLDSGRTYTAARQNEVRCPAP